MTACDQKVRESGEQSAAAAAAAARGPRRRRSSATNGSIADDAAPQAAEVVLTRHAGSPRGSSIVKSFPARQKSGNPGGWGTPSVSTAVAFSPAPLV
ncbi:MAG: hypothetical protein U0166_12170 [Acidobacteriota bacterium]